MLVEGIMIALFIVFAISFINSIKLQIEFKRECGATLLSTYNLAKLDNKMALNRMIAATSFTSLLLIIFTTQNM